MKKGNEESTMIEFKAREIPHTNWQEIVAYCQSLSSDLPTEAVVYKVAKDLGYIIDPIDASLASIKF
jgi:hypothetical protein